MSTEEASSDAAARLRIRVLGAFSPAPGGRGAGGKRPASDPEFPGFIERLRSKLAFQ